MSSERNHLTEWYIHIMHRCSDNNVINSKSFSEHFPLTEREWETGVVAGLWIDSGVQSGHIIKSIEIIIDRIDVFVILTTHIRHRNRVGQL